MGSIDPITFQVIASNLSGVVQEMQTSLFRSGYSTIIRESQDASCGILDNQGRVVGQFVVLPLHMGAFAAAVRGVIESYANIQDGDAFITNHPYLGGTPHSSDMAVVTPVFYQEELVGFCCNIAHKSDLGGLVPGTGSGQAKELYHEGIIVPPVRYVRQGVYVEEVEILLRANSRTPELVIGDLIGQIGTNQLGARRVRALFEKYGKEQMLLTYEHLFSTTEARLRIALSEWKDGTYEGEAYVDHDGIYLDKTVKIHVTVTKQGESIHFDFSKSADQTAGPANILPPLVRAGCYYALIAMIDPYLPNNEGLARVVQTTFREGSVLYPVFPAATNCYIPTAQAVVEAVLSALCQCNKEGILIAQSGADGAIAIGYQSTRKGEKYVQYELLGSAYGARNCKDGVSAVDVHIGNCRTTPIEIIESEFPVRLKRMELIPDSGGCGKFRGGLGFVREYEVLEGGRLTMRADKHTVVASGVEGGKAGRIGGCFIIRTGEGIVSLPSKFGDFILKEGDVLRVERPGGGGWGNPNERSYELVLKDVQNGYVSMEAAEKEYCVVIQDDIVDEIASNLLRANE